MPMPICRPVRLLLAVCLMGAACVVGVPRLCAASIRPHRNTKLDQQAIFGIEDQIRAALLAGDSSVLDRVLADDFLGISANGTLSDKQQYLRRITKHEHSFTRIDTVERKIRLQPATAIVTTTANVNGNLDGLPIAGTFRYTRVYARQPTGNWRVINFEATRVSGLGGADLNRGIPVRH